MNTHEDHVEMRVKEMHSKLNITAAQEVQWNKVKQIMLDDAKNMDALIHARSEHEKEMNAVDNLKSYSDISEEHADGVKKLVPVFATLYASLSDAQKKTADALFRRGGHKHGHMKMESK
ncbi:MAG: Spy/CpxP family protein refolding chaperone [Pseudomonadales bacterium]|nr:Spy/CpxP family protein refolding chaperone [Pseudomonadales bacterium]